MSVQPIKPFLDALRLKNERLRELSDIERKVLGYFCTYTPVEVIHAAGFLPVRVMGGPGSVTKADALAPSFICPYIRLALERGLKGEFDFLSGIVQGYTCDVVCGMVGVWQENIGGEIFHTVPIPYNDGSASRRYFREAIHELTIKLDAMGGHFTEEALDYSLKLHAKIRQVVLDFYEMRYTGRLPLSAGDWLRVIQTGFVTPPEDYYLMLGDLSRNLEKQNGSNATGVPILVSGSIIEEPRVLEILEDSGARVVADDLCTGLRHFYPADGEGGVPIERLIDRYIHRFPCPSRSKAEDRIPMISELIKRSGAEGVVFLFQKFCTPHLAEHPALAEQLKKMGVPSIVVEMEEAGVNEGQLRTRLEAFFEMLRG